MTEYVKDALDRQYYKEVRGDWLPSDSLPAEDFKVHKSLAKYKYALDIWNGCSWLSALFRTKSFRTAKAVHDKQRKELENLVNKSPEYKAALHRIVNNMPANNRAMDILSEFLKD